MANRDEIVNEILQLTDEKLDEISDFILSKSQEFHITNGNVDTGLLLRSGNVNRQFLYKEVVYTAPYSSFIEFGTGPHPVSGLVLERWVERKLRIKQPGAKKVAWAIAHKISKKGTKPYPFLRPAAELARSKYG